MQTLFFAAIGLVWLAVTAYCFHALYFGNKSDIHFEQRGIKDQKRVRGVRPQPRSGAGERT